MTLHQHISMANMVFIVDACMPHMSAIRRFARNPEARRRTKMMIDMHAAAASGTLCCLPSTEVRISSALPSVKKWGVFLLRVTILGWF